MTNISKKKRQSIEYDIPVQVGSSIIGPNAILYGVIRHEQIKTTVINKSHLILELSSG